MTWDELKEEAKKMGADTFIDFIVFKTLFFEKNGDVLMYGETVAKDRTPDQMLAIMKALQQ